MISYGVRVMRTLLKKEAGVIPLPVVIVLMLVLFAGGVYIGQNRRSSDVSHKEPTVDSTKVINTTSPSTSSMVTTNPSVSASPLPSFEIRQDGAEKIYLDHKRKFSFKFSTTLSLGEVSANNNFVQFLENQEGVGKAVRMVLEVYDNPNNVSLEQVIKEKSGITQEGQITGLTVEKMKIDGQEAQKLTKYLTQAELCNWDDGENKKRTFHFFVLGRGFVVNIHPNNSCESYKRDWFEITPESFHFL